MVWGTELSLAGWGVSLLAVMAAGLVLGTVSFGFGVISSPLLLLFLGAKTTIVAVNSLTTVLLSLVLLRTWREVDWRRCWGLVAGGLGAAPVGVLALNWAEPGLLRVVIGVVIVVLGLLSLREGRLPVASFRGSGVLFGFVTCLAVTAISIGGPLGAVYAIAQGWRTEMVRGSLAGMFVLSGLVSAGLYAVAGLYTGETLAVAGMLAPGALAGFGAAGLVVGRLNERGFRYVIVGLVVVGGGMLVGREVWG